MSGVPRSLAKGNKKCPMPILKGPMLLFRELILNISSQGHARILVIHVILDELDM